MKPARGALKDLPALVPLAIRAVLLLAGVALLVLPGRLHPAPFAITAVGVAAAVVAPRVAGASVATAGFLIAWVAASGWAVSLPVGRTVLAAAVLYVLQVSAAFAACVPLDAEVDRAVVRRWLLRCGWPVLLAAPVVAFDEALPSQAGTPAAELAGLLGVLLLAAGGVYVVRQRVRRQRGAS
jgi:hypothetical protein